MEGSDRIGRLGALLGLATALMALIGAGLFAFGRLGFGGVAAASMVAAIGLGGWIDVPLYRRGGRSSPDSPRPLRIGANLGGCLIPLAVAADQAARLPASARGPLAGSVVLVALASFVLARPVEGRGIVLPWYLPGLLGAALGLTLAPACAAGVAYVAGVVGPLLGADLPHLPGLARLGAVRAGIGGGGPFDGLLWSGLLAACLAAGI